MKKKIIIIGTGAVAAEITSNIEDSDFGEIAGIEIKGYIDYAVNIDKYWRHYGLEKPVLGDIDTYEFQDDEYVVIAIANIGFRKIVFEKLKALHVNFINLIHPTAIVARTAQIGTGNIINPFCMIGPKAVLGNFNLLTSQSIISHDSVLGDNNVLSTALLCGHVTVGNDNSFGIRSTVIPEVVIGNQNIIQAGMIVDRKIGDSDTVFYRYKEKVIAIPQAIDNKNE